MLNPIVMPYRGNLEMTQQAMDDCLAQTIDVRLLTIRNGGEGTVPSYDARALHWHHDPPLPSLSATWNRALRFAWEAGAEHALVVNNDVRLWEGTYQYLVETQRLTGALFVTATGVTEAQYTAFTAAPSIDRIGAQPYPLPGPDFSCFLITKECHEKYQFDEEYVPAFCEDLSYHREMMLGGDGARIFGTGLPYLHYGSQTIKSLDDAGRNKLNGQINLGSRAHHARKWGGGANEETYTGAFDPTSARFGVTTAELFERVRNGQPTLD